MIYMYLQDIVKRYGHNTSYIGHDASNIDHNTNNNIVLSQEDIDRGDSGETKR